MMKAYFDNAATTCLDKEVLDAMLPYMQEHYGNPSSIHSFGRYTRAGIEGARKTIARLLNTSPSEIFFTSGGTEADNMAINCSIHDHKLTHAITSKIEHHAVLHTLEALESKGLMKLSFVESDKFGSINLEHLEQLLAGNARSLVSLMHANNELGNLLPIKQVSTLCRKYSALFHSDTVQTMGHYSMDLKLLDVDFINGAAHKFHGPKGVGFIYINGNIKINPLLFGGSQERNMRGGTENLYGIIGLAKAMEIAYRDMEIHQSHIQGIKDYMIERLRNSIPEVEFNGVIASEESLYTVLNVLLPRHDSAEMMLFNLDIAGIAVSGGSACTSGSNQGSHVLRGIDADITRPSIRFSFSKYNTREEVDFAVAKLIDLYATRVKV
jgi:cysteine desulfurase